jgi:hypothetical protein
MSNYEFLSVAGIITINVTIITALYQSEDDR